jgi:hypothetical protein
MCVIGIDAIHVGPYKLKEPRDRGVEIIYVFDIERSANHLVSPVYHTIAPYFGANVFYQPEQMNV